MNKKKILDRLTDKIIVERIKLMFMIDEAHKELLELSPGSTIGDKGIELATFINEASLVVSLLCEADQHLQVLLERV